MTMLAAQVPEKQIGAYAQAIEEARQDILHGQMIDHETVVHWLKQLAQGHRTEPPTP